MKICKIKECNIRVLAKDYCQKHYTRFWRHGDPLYIKYEMHGMSKIPEHNIWRKMKDRCHNENDISYSRYGGRGISVCKQWRNSYTIFFADMGPRPFPKAQIDRKNNYLGYFSENCHWTTRTENNRNKRNNKLTIQKANEIRKRYKAGNIYQRELADIYGVDRSMIGLIINQKIWK